MFRNQFLKSNTKIRRELDAMVVHRESSLATASGYIAFDGLTGMSAMYSTPRNVPECRGCGQPCTNMYVGRWHCVRCSKFA